jgi:hypothetical protein
MLSHKLIARFTAVLVSLLVVACNPDDRSPNGASNPGSGTATSVTAVDDTAQTPKGAAVAVEVLANDSSSDGVIKLLDFDRNSAGGGVIQRDERGTPADTTDDQLVYTPDPAFVGIVSFDYRIENDAGVRATATVIVTVFDGPQANDDVATADTNSANNSIAVLSNDAGDTLVISDVKDLSDGGTAVINNNTIDYTPATDFEGSETFVYEVTDAAGLKDEATVTVTVSTPPVGTNACRTNVTARLDAGQGYCYDAEFVTSSGVTIDFTVFMPHPDQLRANAEATLGGALEAGEPGFAPLLIHGHGFGGSKYGDFSDPQTFLDAHIAKLAWEDGYIVITFSERGFGNSSGQIGLMAPRKEGFDFVELVNWATTHVRENFGLDPRDGDNVSFSAANADHTNPNVAPDAAWGDSLLMTDTQTRLSSLDASVPAGDVALATIGYSYGGAFQFNAQSVDTRVDAMMPMGTWHDLRYSLHPNDTPKTAWITIMTAFSVEGGNGEPLPPIIVEANTEANGVNAEANDAPHNKVRQVSVRNAKKLGPNGTVAYCDGNELVEPDPGFAPINDASESEDPVTPPKNAVTDREMRANLFMIQGYGDTLFTMNEGYDNARCFETQAAEAGLDVRFLAQTSGHPLPAIGPAHYAGSDTGMYLDEIVHCGLEGGIPKKYVMRDVGKAWFDHHLRGLGPTDPDDIFPQVCITQTNTDTDLSFKTGADNPGFSGTSNSANAYQFSREGAVFESVADMPLGCSGANVDTVNCAVTIPATPISPIPGSPSGFAVTTGPDPSQQRPADFLELYTATADQVLAGIPLVELEVERLNASQDEVAFVGVGVTRAADNSTELLHFQVLPIRVFPTAAADVAAQTATTTVSYPKDDPRNFPAEPERGAHYTVRWGANPGGDPNKGRLIGVTARLHAGDKVGLMFYGEHPVFKSISSASVGQLVVRGTVELPLLQADTAPTNVPIYVNDATP